MNLNSNQTSFPSSGFCPALGRFNFDLGFLMDPIEKDSSSRKIPDLNLDIACASKKFAHFSLECFGVHQRRLPGKIVGECAVIYLEKRMKKLSLHRFSLIIQA